MSKFADLPAIIRSSKAGGFLRVNASFSDAVGISSEELSKKPFLDWIVPEDQAQFSDLLEGKIDSCSIRHQTKGCEVIELDAKISETHEDDRIIHASFKNEESKQEPSNNFCGEANVKSTLHEIAHIVENQNLGYKCSILLVEDGRFVKGAGPSLPIEYNNAIDGFAIGPTVGSCGTAIYWNVPVIVNDIQNDPLWVPFAELAKDAGVYSCWSHPFTSSSGNVLGALALYSPEPRVPTIEQLKQLKAAASMTGLAVERGQAEVSLRHKHKQTLELEDQLRQAAKMEALGVLVGGIAHDFNNVLATILANADLSILTIGNMPDSKEREKLESRLKDIVSASQRAGSFCKQMLSYAGHGKVSKNTTEIGALISELDSLVLAALSKKTVLEFSLEEKQIFVDGDENQLLQVLMNLITNAAEALKDKEGRILVSSKVKEFDKETLSQLSPEDDLSAGPYVCLSVADDGSGMDDETKARIFDPFYTTKTTGRGLGLAAVKGIVKMHEGAIFLESTLSKGTTFTVLLPIAQSESTSLEPNSGKSSKIHSISNTNKRILLADDEPDLLSILSETLEYHDYQVVTARDGQEAVDIYRQSPGSFDCVLMDLSMPRLSGHEAATKICEIDSCVPIVLMSGYNEDEVSGRFNDLTLAGSLQKPIAIQNLLDMVDSAITTQDGKKAD